MDETTPLGSIHVSPQAIATIAYHAALQSYGVVGLTSKSLIEGLAHVLVKDPTKGVEVQYDGQSIRIDLYVIPVVAALPAVAAPVGAPAGEAGGSLALALVFALAGGLLLNLMPCVFPVLGIKVMGFVRHAHGDARALWMQGVVFSAGVLVSFLALAGLLLALRAGGAELGWGFQLQSPSFVTLLATLFFLMALNLFGVFEWGGFAQSLPSNLSARGHYADASLAGVLATVVATPCTAPFMGAAVCFTLAQPENAGGHGVLRHRGGDPPFFRVGGPERG